MKLTAACSSSSVNSDEWPDRFESPPTWQDDITDVSIMFLSPVLVLSALWEGRRQRASGTTQLFEVGATGSWLKAQPLLGGSNLPIPTSPFL